MMGFYEKFSLWVLLFTILTVCHGQKIVDTEYGQVQGNTIDVYNGETNSTVDVFYGIPFAEDTSGNNRFRNPIKPDPWSDVFVADIRGDMCPQNRFLLRFAPPDWDRMSENCLHLNIYSPDVNGGPYPVMVWIHGGGYNIGTVNLFPGQFLATYGVVVVTVNYRLNKFGFATTGNSACPGNAGLFDQLMGLQFVVDNIANFGGDPDMITLFGESAGGTSTGLHIVSPLSKDLFHRAITESGTEFCDWAVRLPEDNPEEDFYRGADSLGCPTSPDEAMMECMRSLTWQNIQENSTRFGGGPVVDGPGGFLPMRPTELREQGDIMKGPLISGINHDEGALFIPALVPRTLFDCCDRAQYKYLVENRLVGRLMGPLPNTTQQNIVEAMMHVYSPWPNVYDSWGNRNELVEISSDKAFGTCWNTQVMAHQEVAPTYAYVYNYRGRNFPFAEWIGVPHGFEMPQVWGHTLRPFNPDMNDADMLPRSIIDWTEEDVRQTVFVQKMWTNFAKTGYKHFQNSTKHTNTNQ